MKKIKLIIPTVLILICSSQAGIGSASYQKLGMGARSIAMGRAVIANSLSSTSVFYNPANLCGPANEHNPGHFNGLSTYMANPSYDINYLTSAFSLRYPSFGFGIGVMRYGVNKIPHYDKNMDYLGDFTNMERSVLIGLATRIPYILRFGVSFIYMDQGFNGAYSSKLDRGYGLKAGITFHPFYFYRNITIGASFNSRNMNSNSNNTVRQATTAGFSWKLFNRSGHYFKNITVTTEAQQEEIFPLKLKFGMEIYALHINNLKMYLRAGLDDFDMETRKDKFSIKNNDSHAITKSELQELNSKITFGIGLQFASINLFNSTLPLTLDYALVNEAYRELHFFTISIG